MRAAVFLFVICFAGAAVAEAQSPAVRARAPVQPEPDTDGGIAGEVDIGVRATSIDGNDAGFQRWRDLRPGPTIDRLRYTRDGDTWVFRSAFDHVGYRDQRYAASVERIGRLKASFEWNQVPLFYSSVTRTPYQRQAGTLRLEDGLQAAVQSGAAVAVYAPALRAFDLRSRRDVADARLVYSVSPELDLLVGVRSTRRHGEQPWGASFGLNNAVEVAAPIEQRTSEVTTAAEWSGRRGSARIAYDGSWFGNDVATLVWDNPLRLTDQTHATANVAGDGPSQGRMALWPDSSAHTVSISGSMAMPARTRAFGHVAVGRWLQDDALLPHTINSAIAPIPLPRSSAEAEAHVTSMTYRLTSRPAPAVWLSGQYRLYDFDNRTPHFAVTQYVRLDGNVGTSLTGGSEAFGYTRHFVDVDASLAPVRHAAFRIGYGQELDDRTFRFLETTTDRVFRASLDTAGLSWGSVRLQYDRSVRTGRGLDEQVLSDVGEQVSLRQFDISDRTRDRVTTYVHVAPVASLGLSGSVSVGRENRPDAAFGLQNNDLHALTIGADYAPDERVGIGLSYGYEHYATRQQSRQANPGPQFNDPTRDWWTNLDEDVHTVTLNVDLPRLTDRAQLHVAYDLVASRAAYVYEVRPTSTLAPPRQLSPVRNETHRVNADLRYVVSRRVGLGVGYWFEQWKVDDFAQSPGTLSTALAPGYISLLNQWHPYDAHAAVLRVTYRW